MTGPARTGRPTAPGVRPRTGPRTGTSRGAAVDPVIIVGAGPVGLSLALALARHQVPSVVLDEGAGMSPEGARSTVLRAAPPGFVNRRGYSRIAADGRALPSWRTLRRSRELLHLPLPEEELLHLA